MSKGIKPIVLDFLSQLAENNNKQWFDANRRFYDEAREAFLDFALFFSSQVAKTDPLVGMQDIKKCIYRQNRDVRFSSDKSPYKRHFGVFVAPGGRNSRLPGYYLHIEPNNSLFATGLYCLTSSELKKLRAEVVAFPEELDSIVNAPEFTRRLRLDDNNKLKTLPRGYSIEPAYADYLKYKSLGATVSYQDSELLADTFADLIVDDIRCAKPITQFFRRALDAEPEPYTDDILV